MTHQVALRVGQQKGDIVGQDNRALQAAVDYVARLGGGTVHIGPGTYVMYDALHLASDITLIGQGVDTILRKCPGVSAPLAEDGDYGDMSVQVADAAGFQVGMGLMVTDSHSGGFHILVATIVGMEGNTLHLNGRHRADYLCSRQALAANAFPIISGRHVKHVQLQGLTIDGHKDDQALLNGCRGAGIYFHRASEIDIVNCTVTDFNGDGISFQQSNDVRVLECTCRGNAALGIHPGSGSQRPMIQSCRSNDNGRIGLFFCWRVKHGVAAGNELRGNGQCGISIGHKDTDNLIEGNLIVENGLAGILFRNETVAQGAHRNRVVGNTIRDNGGDQEGYGVKIEGATHDTMLRDNVIESVDNVERQRVGVWLGPDTQNTLMEGNRCAGHRDGDLVRVSE